MDNRSSTFLNMKTKLIIKEIEHTTGGLLIKQCAVLDGVSGKELKIAKLTPELVSLFKSIEIDLDDYVKFIQMSDINPAFKKLVNDFDLKLL